VIPYLEDPDVTLYVGDALEVLRELEEGSCDACVTSPPYLDARPEYPSPSLPQFEEIFREIGRVVDGPLLLNVGRLWRERRELLWWTELLERADWAGWMLRDTIVWAKPNPNPIQGELLANAHEYVFVFGDGCDPDAVRVPYAEGSIARLRRRHVSHITVKGDDGDRNGPRREWRRGEYLGDPNPAGARAPSVIVVPTGRDRGIEHPAPMPLELAIWLVGFSGGSRILDPFAGAGTTLLAARALERTAVGIELDQQFAQFAAERLGQQSLLAGGQG
jgi:DNA modification methylase